MRRVVSQGRSRQRAIVRGVASAVAWSLVACSSETPERVDAGSLDGDVIAVETLPQAPMPPALPASPRFEPCPTGWTPATRAEGDPSTCSPWPASGRHICPPGSEHFPGEPGCRSIGAPCPTGLWPEPLPTDREIIYVGTGTAADGDGTRDAPYASLRTALAAASPGSIVALSKGTHEGPIEIPADVEIRGACAEQSTIDVPSSNPTRAAISVRRQGTRATDLRISGEAAGAWASQNGTLSLRGVLIDGVMSMGIAANLGGLVQGTDVVVRGTRTAPGSGAGGRAVVASERGRIVLERVVIEDSQEAGILVALAGSSVALADTAILRTRSHPATGDFGRGINIQNGGRLEARRTLVAESRDYGIYVARQSTARLEDVLVVDTRPRTRDGDNGGGVNIQSSEVEATRLVVEGNRSIGIWLNNGASLIATDLVVRDTAGNETTGRPGRGLDIEVGAGAQLNRALFARNREIGLRLIDTSTLTASDLTIVRTQTRARDHRAGQGLVAQVESRVRATRVLLEENAEGALFASDPLTNVEIDDLTIKGTLPSGFLGIGGIGAGATLGARLVVRRARFDGNREVSIACDLAATQLGLQDVHVLGTLGRQSSGLYGRGINVEAECELLGERVLIENSHEAGVFVAHGGTASFEDLAVLDTHLADCAPRCSAAANGVVALADARVTLERFLVSKSELVGLQMIQGATIDARNGVVSDNLVGANVQTEGFELRRIQDGVIYRNNAVTLDSTLLPVPSSSVSLGN